MLKFNTAIAALMTLMNQVTSKGSISKEELRIFTILLNPFAPHVTEEVWAANALGEGLVAQQPWPAFDEAKCKDDTVEIVVQVGGKVRANIVVPTDSDEAAVVASALAEPKIARMAEGMDLVKSIVVKGRLVNLIFKPKA